MSEPEHKHKIEKMAGGKPVGIFDSGVGGLTVVKEIKKRHPKMPIVYFGDTARVPWGNKSKKVVCRYAGEVAKFLVARGCQEIVIGCNTAPALAGNYLRKKYPKIKFYDVIEPVIEKIRKNPKRRKKILIIGTRGTIASGAYAKKIRKVSRDIKVFSQACPLFVPLVEEGWLNNEVAENIARQYLKKYVIKKNSKINIRLDSIVLGCTHYPLLEKMPRKLLGRDVEIINGAREVAEKISVGVKSIKSDLFYFSDKTNQYQKLAEKILGKKINISIKKL